ncbi:MAG: TonB-dependent receptor [Opitutaceae bacterium]
MLTSPAHAPSFPEKAQLPRLFAGIPEKPLSKPRGVLRSTRNPLLVAVLLFAAMLQPLFGQGGDERKFDLPADTAEKSLKLFSGQSGLGLVVNANILTGIRTNAVQGDFVPADALRQLLANTELTATQDAKTGAFVVHREKAGPNGVGRSPQGPQGNDGSALGQAPSKAIDERLSTDEIVNLAAFTVTAELGKYSEVSSSSGTKTSMALKDIAGSVQVLNAPFIADIRATSLEDLYPYVVGMNREGTTAAGFTMRGFSNSNPDITLNNVEVDGLPGLASRWGSPTTANVERVDIPKGPSSVLYGLLNPGGLVNIITKQPQRTAFTSMFVAVSSFAGSGAGLSSGDLGSQATVDSTGPVGSGGHLFYRMIASLENLPSFRGNGYFKNRYFFPSLTYRLNENTEVTAKMDVTRQTRSSDSGLVAPYFNPALVASRTTVYQDQGPGDDEFDNGEVYTVSLHHHFVDDWLLSVNGRSVQHRDGRSLFENNGVISPLVGGIPDVANAAVIRRFRNLLNSRTYNLLDANLTGGFGPADLRHTLLVGVAANNEVQQFQGLTNGPNSNATNSVNVYHPDLTNPVFPVAGTGPANSAQRFYNYGAYASDQLKIGSYWRANASVRYDKQDSNYNEYILHRHEQQSVHSVVPSFGLMYQPVEAVSLYGSYSVSFRPSEPIFVDASGNAGFPAEKAHQFEVGVKAEWPTQHLTATVSAYDIVKQNVTEAIAGGRLPNGLQTYLVTGEQESKGVEVALVYLPRTNWQLQLGYSYIDARVTKSVTFAQLNARLFNVPHNDLSFWTRYNFTGDKLKGLGVGIGEIYVGDRVGGYPTVTAAGTYRAGILPMPSYAKTNLALFYQWKRYDMALNIGNVFDRDYLASIRNQFTVIPGDPRKITFSIRIPL